MANFIETFLTTREFEFRKTGNVHQTETEGAYISREVYTIPDTETLRGLNLQITVETLWLSRQGRGVVATAQAYRINNMPVSNEKLLETLRMYL